MGTARGELTALLGESLLRTRKNFGMFGQIQISIKDVTPQWLSVEIFTRHPLEGASVALSVRNAVLNWLQDLLPVERFIAVYENPTLGITGEVHDLPYAEELPKAGQVRSSEILFEEVAGPAREELRPRFRVAWQRFVEEETGLRTVEDIYGGLSRVSRQMAGHSPPRRRSRSPGGTSGRRPPR